jgi:beta-lactamase regulating signal transducer with metallopeptidase domain
MIATLADAAVTMSQSVELSIVAKSTAIVAAGLVAARLASHARASVRHLFLAATFASLVALPLLLVAWPHATIDVPVAYTRAAAASAAGGRPASAAQPGAVDGATLDRQFPQLSGLKVARAVWLAGAALFLAPVPIVLWRLRRIRRTGLPWSEFGARTHALALARGMRRPVELMLHELVPGPITFGVLRPVIVMPADAGEWPEADVRRAVVHELEHIQRGDWVVLLVARSICACYWFHPLAWVAWRQLSLEAERSCDDAVVLNEERTDYAEQLVTLARRLSVTEEAPMLGMANRSNLSTRVSALLDDRQRRGRAGLGLITGAIAAAGLVVLTIAPVRAVAAVETAVKAEPADAVTGAVTGQEQRDRRARRPRALDRALYEAAKDGDLNEVNQIILAGANVNGIIEGDGSPLIGAAQSGVLAVARRLLDAGADPDLPVDGDGSPLIHAAARGHLDIVTLLLDRGADVNQIVPGDENALMCASEQGQLPVVQLLVKHGANVNERIWSGGAGRDGEGEWRTAVSQARKNRHTAVVSFLMSVGARE